MIKERACQQAMLARPPHPRTQQLSHPRTHPAQGKEWQALCSPWLAPVLKSKLNLAREEAKGLVQLALEERAKRDREQQRERGAGKKGRRFPGPSQQQQVKV